MNGMSGPRAAVRAIWAAAAIAITGAAATGPVVIHPAVASRAEQQGERKGPGQGLGSTPPAVPIAGRGGRAGRAGGPPPIPPPLEAPEVARESAAIEQTADGSRAAIPPLASFDGLGEGFHAGRGGIDISLAVGP